MPGVERLSQHAGSTQPRKTNALGTTRSTFHCSPRSPSRRPFAGDTVPNLPAGILQDCAASKEWARCSTFAAHPDDENTQLITYLSRGRGYRTAYLSLTRGDGGQNEIGSEFGEKLGRRPHAGAPRRAASRRRPAVFSPGRSTTVSPRTTARRSACGTASRCCDVVRVIREYRPDVVITRFSAEPGTTPWAPHRVGGAGDRRRSSSPANPKGFPEHSPKAHPWQPKRILQNGGGRPSRRGRQRGFRPCRSRSAGNDPVPRATPLGGPNRGSAAAVMHKTQAFGGFSATGSSGPRGRESFTPGFERRAGRRKDILRRASTRPGAPLAQRRGDRRPLAGRGPHPHSSPPADPAASGPDAAGGRGEARARAARDPRELAALPSDPGRR